MISWCKILPLDFDLLFMIWFLQKKKKKEEKGGAAERERRRKMFDEEVDKFETYEDYLDSLVSEEDHKYLEDEEMARTIAELGYR